jgi:hypothetical protein
LNITKRHHYIPEFWIKGFVAEDGSISVFNKDKGELEKKRKSPKQIFFEWNRNSFNINGEKNDFIEKLYQLGESQFSKTHNKIIEKQEQIELSPYEIFHLMYFISEMHWRLPSQDNNSDDYINKIAHDNSILKVKDKITGENISEKVFDKLKNEPFFIKTSKVIRGMEDFIRLNKNIKLENWRLFYIPENNPQLGLLSDNPLIIRDNKTSNILESELIFSISKGKTIYHTNGKILREIPSENRIDIDVLTFIQAKKMVCGSNPKYLEDIANLSKLYDTENRVKYLKEKVFEIFE